ncbi:MAG: glutamine amidotransferase [Alphaproteobacteria bacterium]
MSKVLLIVHSRTSDSGRVGRILSEWGYTLDTRCPLHDDELPESMTDYAGAVVFGGPQSVHDRTSLAPIQKEIDWIGLALDSGKPFLGICLGAQMLAHALGAKVDFHPAELHEIGYTTIRPTSAWRGTLDAPTVFYQWHKEGFELPRAGTLLAEGDMFPNQAFKVDGNVYGLQFHPEVTRPIVERWLNEPGQGMKRPEAQPRDRQLDANLVYDPAVERWTQSFLLSWIGRPERS